MLAKVYFALGGFISPLTSCVIQLVICIKIIAVCMYINCCGSQVASAVGLSV